MQLGLRPPPREIPLARHVVQHWYTMRVGRAFIIAPKNLRARMIVSIEECSGFDLLYAFVCQCISS